MFAFTHSLAARLFAATALLAAASLPAQEPSPIGAGFGALYADLPLDPATGNALQLGVAVDASGHFFVSATGPLGLPPHVVYEFDSDGQLVGSFPQLAEHNTSGFGMRDLEFDGQNLLGGSEAGISVFSTTGARVSQIRAANGLQTIVQPIRGPVAAVLPVFRALALDPNGNSGNGSLLVADFTSPIYEIDFAGNILATFQNSGWSAYGLAIDPVTRNPWVFAGPGGQIEELDRTTMVPTGRRFLPVADGAPGGLSVASPIAGHHEPWPNLAAFAHVVQGNVDRIGVQRLHLFPGVLGWNELTLQVGRNGGPLAAGLAPFWTGDQLDFRFFDPTGLRNGLPAWLVFNVYNDANRNGYTDLTPLLPGSGISWEHRSLNALSLPGTLTFLITAAPIGVTRSWTLPATMPLSDRDLFRIQALYIEPASPQQQIASTNVGFWQAQAGERGIVIAAEGTTSFNAGQAPPFWLVRSDATHAHGAVLAVEFTTIGAVGAVAQYRFDIDQGGMNDRFDGGNSQLPGFLGTYRLGSEATCGLDFAAPATYVAPFHVAGESAGVAFSVPPDAAGYVPDLIFSFAAFLPGLDFVFDCDTDGGPPSGADHAGLLVRITTANSGVLSGLLQRDPIVPDRAVIWFP